MSKQPVENNAELVYHDTSHNTFMMLDSDGRLIYQVKDGSAPVIVEPAQVIALYQFLRRPTVELAVMHAMRRWLEASSPEGAEIMALVDQHLPPLPPIVPLVRMAREVCDDAADTERYGTETGTEFWIEVGDEKVLVYFPDQVHRHSRPMLFAFGESGWYLDQVDQVLPLIATVLSDPRVVQIRQRVAAGLPALPLAREFGSAA
jgi:hypothetical protein